MSKDLLIYITLGAAITGTGNCYFGGLLNDKC